MISIRRRLACVSWVAAALSFSGLVGAQETLTDDFERPDGPVDGWTVSQGTWSIADGRLTTTSAGVAASHIWLGAPPVVATGDLELTAKVSFGPPTADGIGRHGGFIFCASEASRRDAPAQTGYTVDWIDRVGDFGLRLHRVDPGVVGAVFTPLVLGTPGLVDVPEAWTVQFDGDVIRVLADGVPVIEATDGTYREGLIGAWAHANNTTLFVDDLQLTYFPKVLETCFTASAPVGPAPLSVDFDATCTQSLHGIEAYDWDYGDGEVGTGATTTHEFLAGGSYMVTLTVRDTEGNTGTATTTIEVYDSSPSFHDGFERADGPPAGWTVSTGDWAIRGGALEVSISEGVDTAPEASIFAGDPPARFEGITSIEFDMEFLVDQPEDPLAVGRHAGAILFAESPNPRGAARNDGYVVDWLDNAAGFHGGRLYAVRDGVGGPHLIEALDAEPGRTWRVELDGDTIRLLVDGTLKGEVVDPSFRFGHFGFWAYPGNPAIGFVQQVRFDNLAISAGGDERPKFHRGDANDDGGVNITDGIYILNFLFLGGETPTCSEAANVNDDDAINITDGIYVLNFLFLGGAAPAPPGPVEEPCGPDPEGSPGDLGCEAYASC